MMTAMFAESHLEPIDSRYDMKECLGKGVTSVVKRCVDRTTHKSYACKIMDKEAFRKAAQVEVGIMLKLSHPNIIQLHAVYETDQNVKLVLELVTGGELFDRIIARGYYSEQDAAGALRQVLSAVAYLHRNNVIHRDLKPENLLYANTSSNSPLKIADFGLSRVLPGKTKMTVCGTPGYVAPEVLQGKDYNTSVDMWAVGVLTYILLCGFEPFYEEKDCDMYVRILRCSYEFLSPYWDSVGQGAKDLIRKLLKLSPDDRLTAEEALHHPWIKGETSKATHLPSCQKLREFNAARRRFRVAIDSVLAANRLRSLPNSRDPSPTPFQQVQCAKAAQAVA